MKKNQVYVALIILVVGASGWLGYKFFFKKKTSSNENVITAQSFSPNSCWVYHEYVYRVDFSDQSINSFLFVRDPDGTFPPSNSDSSGNHVIGNGFIIDSTGACSISETIARPWELSDNEQLPLKEIVEKWLDFKEGLQSKDYHITGQTVALFVVLNDPKNFIEYTVAGQVPGQKGYSMIYPSQKTLMKGIETRFPFSNNFSGNTSLTLQVLKTTFDENNAENPAAVTAIDSISVEKDNEGYLNNIKVLKGDEFFYEGSTVFNESGNYLGNLDFRDKKWKLVPVQSFVQNPPAYEVNYPQEIWEYDLNNRNWKKN
jgi:hypothetical protein